MSTTNPYAKDDVGHYVISVCPKCGQFFNRDFEHVCITNYNGFFKPTDSEKLDRIIELLEEIARKVR